MSAASEWGDAAEGVGFAFRPAPGPGAPAPSTAFGGTWRFTGGAPGAGIDWTVQANQFPTSTFAVSVYEGRQVQSGSTAGWTCEVQSLASTNNSLRCNADPGTPALAPGSPVSGHLELTAPGTNTMPVEVIAPTAEGSSSQTSYRMSKEAR